MLTYWDNLQELKTSSMLLAETLEEHYKIYSNNFTSSDYILDVGCGNGDLAKYVVNVTGVDEKTDLNTCSLSVYNTLNFSESIGYISPIVLERLIGAGSIQKVVIKDFMCSVPVDTKYFNYDFTRLHLSLIHI